MNKKSARTTIAFEDDEFYVGKNDRVFKTILCNEKNQKMLEWFLSRTIGRKIKIVRYLRNEQPINTMVEKVKIVDLLVELEGEILHLELNNNMDSTKAKIIQRRNYIYVSSDYAATVERGADYSKEHKMLAVDLSYGLGEDKNLYEYYYVQSDNGEKYVEDLSILVVNMDKVEAICYNGPREEIEKVKHLKMLNANKEELLQLSKGDEVMSDFTEQIITLNESPKFRKIMSDEKAAIMWENTERSLAREAGLAEGRTEGRALGHQEGHQEGLQEGLQEGIREGRKDGQRELINKMKSKGITIEEISEMLELSMEDIKEILNS